MPLKPADAVGAGIFFEMAGDVDPVFGIDGNQAAVEGPVEVGAKGKPIGNGIVAGLVERGDVASIDHADAGSGHHSESGNAAGLIVHPEHHFLKSTGSNKAQVFIVLGHIRLNRFFQHRFLHFFQQGEIIGLVVKRLGSWEIQVQQELPNSPSIFGVLAEFENFGT